ncbi:MAG: helix-turn-helix domain-containing protein [Clostridiales bacterium]|jgi:hypothetical protein|nr:helix-turn-helix domain-containing protein [Eubacteriales bacterium]MDH7566884.1 helix-turn-helix domain-containing protein [Clostridiales bacterium]
MSKRKYFSDELAAAIKARYDGSSEAITELQKEFNVPRYTITTYARKFGVTRKKLREWTSEEEDLLRELWGQKTLPQIMKIMGRTKTSILNKYKRLGLEGATRAGEYLTACAVSDLLGVDVHAITERWIEKYGLKATRKAMRGVKKMWMIRMEDLLQWLKNNQDKWDSRRVEPYALGEEPEWLKAKREADSKKTLRTAQKWTPEEDAKAIMLFKAGMNYVQIGKQLQRSREAVERRLSRLDVWGSGKFVGDRKYKTSGRFAELKEQAERRKLITRLAELILIKRNQIAFDGYWQKSMCMNWHDIKGCTAGQNNCDECTEFIRIQEQYCRRCGATFYKRQISDICDPCATARKKQYQRKWVIMNRRKGLAKVI